MLVYILVYPNENGVVNFGVFATKELAEEEATKHIVPYWIEEHGVEGFDMKFKNCDLCYERVAIL